MSQPDPPDQLDPLDPLGLATDAPLLAAWLDAVRAADSGRLGAYVIPGHKQRTDLIGAMTHGDLQVFNGVTSLRRADALLAAAQARAAEFFGADWCAFSVAGSSHGNQALALSVGRPGQPIVVARTLHRSQLIGLVLAGLHPVWVHPPVHPTGLPLGIEPDAVRAALREHPDACAVLVTDPTYVGTCADLPAVADVAHAHGVPLLVDAAWAAHFAAGPPMPAHALAAGADAVVTSAHKTLPALSQSALVMARTTRSGGLLEPERLQRAFEVGHTTSPSGPVLASLDAARALLARQGPQLAERLAALAGRARRELAAIPGVAVPGVNALDGVRLDPAKVVVLLAGTGTHGHDLEDTLNERGLLIELADRELLIPMLTMADDDASVDRLVTQVRAAIERHRGPARAPSTHAAWTVRAEGVLSPREAFFAEQHPVAWADAAGRVCAELIAPYPPGVPVLAPGELITREALDALTEIKAQGGRVAYAADPSLATVRVVA